ncbi:DUF4262 domain-containing protein [Streptomycetaceae bacterium NBC_01309]
MSKRATECGCVLCRPNDVRNSGSARDAAWADKLAATVREHGWTVVAVPADEHGPAFAYTVGLPHTAHVPELAMLGLPIQVMHTLLNNIASRIRDGAPAADGTRVDGLLAAGLALVLKDADPGWHPTFFGQTAWFHRAAVPVRQVVWPDPAGVFPWEDGFDQACRTAQPTLWIPPDRDRAVARTPLEDA